ncbi:MAG: hypothetical protein JSV65_14970 [Armatimonadota bacterium]|nr:MAG: hypothetical protein JSV65_14970 [Armatimonadota bacterium]
MRTTLAVLLCCFLIITAAASASAQDEDNAVNVVREFARALTTGDLQRAAALITQDSVWFMSSATSIAPPPSMKDKPEPMFFDQQLSDAEAQAIRGLLDSIILAAAVKIEPGQPVRTEQGIRVPVTVELKRDILVTKENERLLVDLAAQYPAALEAIQGMTEEGEETTEEEWVLPDETTGEMPEYPGEAPVVPGETPGPGASAPAPGGTVVGETATQPGATGAPASEEEEARRQRTCLANLKQLALGFLMCAQDYDERLPNAANWMDMITPYIKDARLFHCPSDKNQYSYAMNSALSGVSIGDIDDPVNAVMLFESRSGSKNAADPLQSLCMPPRHGAGNNFAFVDGHAEFIAME